MYVHEMIIQVQIDWFKFATFSPVKHIVCQSTLPTKQRAGSRVMRVGSDTFGDPIFQKGLQN